MHLATALLATLCCCSPAHAFGGGSSKKKDAILLSNVEALTLRGHGARTTHRRVSSIPQLSCISHPSLCRLADLDRMRCTNQGSSYSDADVEWSCSATLPDELRLGSTDVTCEGYSSSNDPYILKGSCGVEYRLVLTDKGEQRYPDLARSLEKSGPDSVEDWLGYLLLALLIGFFAWFIYSSCTNLSGINARQARRAPRRGWTGGGGNDYGPGGGGGGGFGGGFGDDDPPPPYPGRKQYSSGQRESWRPGFWSGLATGGAAGYATGSRNRNRNYDDYRPNNGGGSSWPGSSRSTGESSSSGSRAGPSGNRHESTGFGSTSRR